MRPSGRARVLAALLHAEATGHPYPSIRDLATMTGLGLPTVHKHLEKLRRLGLVAWEPYLEGTLRSTVAVVVGPWCQREAS